MHYTHLCTMKTSIKYLQKFNSILVLNTFYSNLLDFTSINIYLIFLMIKITQVNYFSY